MFPQILQRIIKETKELLKALVAVLVIQTFFYRPFGIPSGSMMPGLLVGDFIFVNKFTYGYGNESFPLRFKWMKSRLWHTDPKRGDIIVFNNNKDPEKRDFIKRVIALPGDTVQMCSGIVYVNHQPYTLKRVEDFGYPSKERLKVCEQYDETNTEGRTYRIAKHIPFGQAQNDNTKEYVVPTGHYFVMGDNRDYSIDSRWSQQVGFVSKDWLLGRATMIFFSTEAKWYEIHKWVFSIRPNRLLRTLN